MDSIIRGTTPTISLTVPGLSEINPQEIWFTFKSGTAITTFQYSETDDLGLDGDTIILNLSQEQTLSFNVGILYMQVRLLDVLGMAYATPVLSIMVNDVLQGGVIELLTIEDEEQTGSE